MLFLPLYGILGPRPLCCVDKPCGKSLGLEPSLRAGSLSLYGRRGQGLYVADRGRIRKNSPTPGQYNIESSATQALGRWAVMSEDEWFGERQSSKRFGETYSKRMDRMEEKAWDQAQGRTVWFLALIFLSLTLLLYLGFRTDKALTTSLQKIVFPLGISLLLSGLVTLLFYIQLDDRQEARKKGPLFYPIFSGVLAVICMFLALSYMGVYPVGERSTMIVDMHHQYAPLLSLLKDRLLHGGGVLYSFEVGLGASFLPLFGYYLASPLNLLLCLFPDSMLTDGILVITLIKVGLAAAFFTACIQYIHRRRDLSLVACSLMYALMMYMLAYFWNIMWLDVVMILPLVVMSFEKLMREGKYLPYILTLAYALYANYYIGFMLCLFLVLYFVFMFCASAVLWTG